MEVNISGAMDAQLRLMSRKLGFKEQDIVKRAVLVYLNSLEKQRDLKEELSELDSLSDEALLNFERSL